MPRNKKKTGPTTPNGSTAKTAPSSIATVTATTVTPPSSQPSPVSRAASETPTLNPNATPDATVKPTGETSAPPKSPKKNNSRRRGDKKKKPTSTAPNAHNATASVTTDVAVQPNGVFDSTEALDGVAGDVNVEPNGVFDSTEAFEGVIVVEKSQDCIDHVDETPIMVSAPTSFDENHGMVSAPTEQVALPKEKIADENTTSTVSSADDQQPAQKTNPFARKSPNRRVVKAKQPPPPVDLAEPLTPTPEPERVAKNGGYSNLKSPSQAREKEEEEKELSRQHRLTQTTKQQKVHKKALIDEKRKNLVETSAVSSDTPVVAMAVPASMSVEPQYPEHKRAASSVQDDEMPKRFKQGEAQQGVERTARSIPASFPDEDVENVSRPDDEDDNGSSIWKMTGLLAAAAVIAMVVVVATRRKGK